VQDETIRRRYIKPEYLAYAFKDKHNQNNIQIILKHKI